MEYTIVKETSVDALVKMVNEHISNGWVPQGGVCKIVEHYKYYAQAMIKITK
jgi:hypothetical protein